MNHELINLARSVGSDKDYLEWVKRQPSCISGVHSEYHDTGEAFSIPAHYRTVARGAGTGYKPPYSAIPLTHAEHSYAHQHGDGMLMAPHKWELLAERYLRSWIDSVLTNR